MRYLLDTNVAIWFFQGNPRLGPKTSQLIADAAEYSYVSYVTMWELSIKSSLGKIRIARPLDEFIQGASLSWLPIRLEHFGELTGLPPWHRDPFDCLLIAQALSEKLTLVTGDAEILRYPRVKLVDAKS